MYWSRNFLYAEQIIVGFGQVNFQLFYQHKVCSNNCSAETTGHVSRCQIMGMKLVSWLLRRLTYSDVGPLFLTTIVLIVPLKLARELIRCVNSGLTENPILPDCVYAYLITLHYHSHLESLLHTGKSYFRLQYSLNRMKYIRVQIVDNDNRNKFWKRFTILF